MKFLRFPGESGKLEFQPSVTGAQTMKTYQKIAAIILVLLLGATVYGLFQTAQSPPLPQNPGNSTGISSTPTVDKTPILGAQRLAQMPTTEAELPFAQKALETADHEMDLAYAAAERQIEDNPVALSAEAKQIQARLKQAED